MTGPGFISPLPPGMPLAIKELYCFFGATQVVQNINLNVASGEHLAIIGGNGSGKTTLLRAIMGLHSERSGEIRVDNQLLSPRPLTPHPRMVWMPQRQPKGQFPFTVNELLSFGPGAALAHEAALELGLGPLIHRPVSALSGGQLQRAYLARALGHLGQGGSLLLADEPTAALDFDGQEQVAHLLLDLPATMLVITHDLSLAKRCHRVLHMAQGQMREVSLDSIPGRYPREVSLC